ncbi:Conserved_hypothetical protein [Hexamita inflata]|uniref:Uncharacterized protein n=1 Tax=Hexamita inflata TaxID=28002 RepID=A0ABP1H0S7_9EUKA
MMLLSSILMYTVTDTSAASTAPVSTPMAACHKLFSNMNWNYTAENYPDCFLGPVQKSARVQLDLQNQIYNVRQLKKSSGVDCSYSALSVFNADISNGHFYFDLQITFVPLECAQINVNLIESASGTVNLNNVQLYGKITLVGIDASIPVNFAMFGVVDKLVATSVQIYRLEATSQVVQSAFQFAMQTPTGLTLTSSTKTCAIYNAPTSMCFATNDDVNNVFAQYSLVMNLMNNRFGAPCYQGVCYDARYYCIKNQCNYVKQDVSNPLSTTTTCSTFKLYGMCVQLCPNGFVADQSNNCKKKCDVGTEYESGSGIIQCLKSTNAKSFFNWQSSSSNSCADFSNGLGKSYKSCSQNLLCQMKCWTTSCPLTSYVFGSTCISDCGATQSKNGLTCTSCTTYTNNGQCTTTKSIPYLVKQQEVITDILPKCPVNLVQDITGECVESCDSSKGYSNVNGMCTTCQNYVETDQSCSTTCKSAIFIVTTDIPPLKKCVASCNQFLKNVDGIQQCVSTCAPQYVNNMVCTGSCTYYYVNAGEKICTTIDSSKCQLIIQSTGECLQTTVCPNGLKKNGQFCVAQCLGDKPFEENGICIATCNYHTDLQNAQICQSAECADFIYYIGTEKYCIKNNCPYTSILISGTKICIDYCALQGLYLSNGVCVSTCPNNKYYIDGKENKCIANCDQYNFEIQQASQNLCSNASQCPDTYYTYNKICSLISCKAQGKYYNEGSPYICIDNCAQFLQNNEICKQSCQYFVYVNTQKVCQAQCPSNASLQLLFSTNVYQCVANCGSLFADNGICSNQCSSGYFTKDSNGYKTCTSSCSLYIDGAMKQCVPSCSSPYPYQQGSICYETCPSAYPILLGNTCVNKCDSSTILDETKKQCISVATCKFTYYKVITIGSQNLGSQYVCLDACPSGTRLIQSTKICVDSCASDTFKDGDNLVCISSCSSLTYEVVNGEKVCRADCPTYYIMSNDYKVCRAACQAGELQYVQANSTIQCVVQTQCNTSYYLDGTTCKQICPNFVNLETLQCVLQCTVNGGLYYYQIINGNKVCKSSCDSNQVMQNNGNNLVQCINPEQCTQFVTSALYCESSCPDNMYEQRKVNNQIVNYCVTCAGQYYIEQNGLKICVGTQCPSSKPFLSGSICILECPNYYYGSNICTDDCAKQNLKTPATGKQCTSTCDTQYQYETSCLSSCQDNAPPKKTPVSPSKICLDNCNFEINNQCQVHCDYINENNICIDKDQCKSYVYNPTLDTKVCNTTSNQCLSNQFSFVDSDGITRCVAKCSDVNAFIIENTKTCQLACPNDHPYLTQSGDTCTNSCPLYVDVFANKCISSCANFITISGLKYCISSCQDQNKVMQLSPITCKDTDNTQNHINGVETDKTCKQFQDAYPGNELALYIYQNQKQCLLKCPPSTFMENNICSDKCTTGFYKIIDQVAVCQLSCPLYRQVGQQYLCVDECALYEYKHDQLCSQDLCPYASINRVCVVECGSLYKQDNWCVDKCNSLIFINIATNKNECITVELCSGYQQQNVNGMTQCVASCLPNYVENNICTTQCTQNMYKIITPSNEKQCIADESQCPTYIYEGQVKKCQICADKQYTNGLCTSVCDSYLLGSTCYNDSCPENYYASTTKPTVCKQSTDSDCQYYYVVDSIKYCIQACNNPYPYLDGKQCVDKCNAFYQESICVASCTSKLYIIQNGKYICTTEENCIVKLPTQVNDVFQCVSECPQNQYASPTDKICSGLITCTYYNQQKICQTSCPLYVSSAGQCVDVCSESMYKIDSKGQKVCVSDCSGKLFNDTVYDRCIDKCSDENMFVDGKRCVAQCDLYYDNGQDKFCTATCSSPYIFINGKQCVQQCANFVDDARKCIAKCESPNFILTNTTASYCLAECPLYFQGSQCVDTCTQYLTGKNCSSTCSAKYTYVDSATNIVMCTADCVSSGFPFVDNQNRCQLYCNELIIKQQPPAAQICVSECSAPNKFISPPYCLTTCDYYFAGIVNQCVTSCDKFITNADSTHQCIANCKDLNMAYYDKCVPITDCLAVKYDGQEQICIKDLSECAFVQPATSTQPNVCLSQCSDKYYIKNNVNYCVSSCPTNYPITYGNMCITIDDCKDTIINNVCVSAFQCPPDKLYYRGQCIAPENCKGTQLNGVCYDICQSGYIPLVNGSCVIPCEDLQILTAKGCVNQSDKPVIEEDGHKVEVQCLAPAIIEPYTKTCIYFKCQTGYIYNQGVCVSISECNIIYNGMCHDSCRQIGGGQLVNGKCVQDQQPISPVIPPNNCV